MKRYLIAFILCSFCLVPGEVLAKSNSHNHQSNGGVHHNNINSQSNSGSSSPSQPPGQIGNQPSPQTGSQGTPPPGQIGNQPPPGQIGNQPPPAMNPQGPVVGTHLPPGGTTASGTGTGSGSYPVPYPQPQAVPHQVPQQVPQPTPVATPPMVPPLVTTGTSPGSSGTVPVPTPTPTPTPMMVPNQVPQPTPVATPPMVPPLVTTGTSPGSSGTVPVPTPTPTPTPMMVPNQVPQPTPVATPPMVPAQNVAVVSGQNQTTPSLLPGNVSPVDIGHAAVFQNNHAITKPAQLPGERTHANTPVVLPPQVTHGVITPFLNGESSQLVSKEMLNPNYCLLPTTERTRGSFGGLLNPPIGWTPAEISSSHHVALKGGSGFSDTIMRSIPASHPAHSACLVFLVN